MENKLIFIRGFAECFGEPPAAPGLQQHQGWDFSTEFLPEEGAGLFSAPGAPVSAGQPSLIPV